MLQHLKFHNLDCVVGLKTLGFVRVEEIFNTQRQPAFICVTCIRYVWSAQRTQSGVSRAQVRPEIASCSIYDRYQNILLISHQQR